MIQSKQYANSGITLSGYEDAVVLHLVPEFREDEGIFLLDFVKELFNKGTRKFIFDFSKVTVLTSPAIAYFIEMVEFIVDNNGGEFFFYKVNPLYIKVLDSVGMSLSVKFISNLDEIDL